VVEVGVLHHHGNGGESVVNCCGVSGIHHAGR
jgi:hypothetical protein